MTTGAYYDNNNASWDGDRMWPSSGYVNPTCSPVNDHEKPEVVAVGESVTTLGNANFIGVPQDGTSLAAPQVAGLATMLIQRNFDLMSWPTALRAILMSSATHNIEGSTRVISGEDVRDGQGAINALAADDIARMRNNSDVVPCIGSCWWGSTINSNSFPDGLSLYRYFTAYKDDLVRVAISWWSNPDCPNQSNCTDQLSSDLDLRVLDPAGQLVSNGYSVSYCNNYELVEFAAPMNGTYRIRVDKSSFNEAQNDLGIAVLIEHRRAYLPFVGRDASSGLGGFSFPSFPTPTPMKLPAYP